MFTSHLLEPLKSVLVEIASPSFVTVSVAAKSDLAGHEQIAANAPITVGAPCAFTITNPSELGGNIEIRTCPPPVPAAPVQAPPAEEAEDAAAAEDPTELAEESAETSQ